MNRQVEKGVNRDTDLDTYLNQTKLFKWKAEIQGLWGRSIWASTGITKKQKEMPPYSFHWS